MSRIADFRSGQKGRSCAKGFLWCWRPSSLEAHTSPLESIKVQCSRAACAAKYRGDLDLYLVTFIVRVGGG